MDISTYKYQFEQVLQALNEITAQLAGASEDCQQSRNEFANMSGSSSRAEAADATGGLETAQEKLREAITQVQAAASTIEAHTGVL